MKTPKEVPHKARVFWQKAERYARAAHSNLGEGEYDPAMSCAVNAIINLVDALCVQYSGERSASENHHDAVRLLTGLNGMDPKTRDAVGKRLSMLLSIKSLAQYDGELTNQSQAEDAVRDMDRALSAVAGIVKKHGWG